MADWSKAALVLAGHGSARNPDSRGPTERLAAEIRDRRLFAEVAACFLKEPPFLGEALSLVAADEIYVVPNFAGGYLTRVEVPRALGLDGPLTRRDGRVIRYAEPVGSHPLIPELLRRRVDALIAGAALDPAQACVLVIGHGSARPGSSATVEEVAETLRRDGGYGSVTAAYLEQAPFVADWPKLTAAEAVIAAPLLIAEGLHGSEDLPPLFGLARGDTGPGRLHGRRTWLCRGIGSDPEIVEVILERVAECDRQR